MCGIAGFLEFGASRTESECGSIIAAMADVLHHRGPDSRGSWIDAAAGVGLGLTRLAILDLSPAGHQPMVSASERFVIAYNGEVYNHRDVLAELGGKTQLRGHSDTEVILEACARWGVPHAVERLNGMFAFVLWDRQTRTLWLVRDRLGIKPLYWGRSRDLFLFGSELKALRAHPGWTPIISRDALSAYLRFAYVPAPLSIYQGIFKLEPGTILTLRGDQEPQITRYWDMRAIARSGIANRLKLDETSAIDELESLLCDAVKQQMTADVPIGAFLSGGIDSSTVVALMQSASSRPVKTFSIGFRERGYDEVEHAKAVARHIGTDHTEFYLDPATVLDIIPNVPEWFDEPFADSSQIPTYLVSTITRQHVKVALTGDGGDELFFGYSHYRKLETLWRKLCLVPLSLRRSLAQFDIPERLLSWRMSDQACATMPRAGRLARLSAGLRRARDILPLDSADALYRFYRSEWDMPDRIVQGAREPRGVLWDEAIAAEVVDFGERMQLFDLLTYLPDDILTKVDRASMAVSLETRVPLLDHRVAEFVWRLPRNMKVRHGQGKWLLRRVLHRHVPSKLVERPKMGFSVPIHSWLRGPLRDWAENLLSERRLREDSLLEPGPIRARWLEHISGQRDWNFSLWTVLMFQCWKERWSPG